jgi:hypothetical protein
MRDLSMMEIEQVSGAGWQEWWGGVQESISQFIDRVAAFFSDAPHPTQSDIDNAVRLCSQSGGVQNMTISTNGATATLTVVGAAVSGSYTKSSGSWSTSCFPSGGEQG